jgi:hypothetical protein
MRLGSRYTWGPGRIDGAILIGHNKLLLKAERLA